MKSKHHSFRGFLLLGLACLVLLACEFSYSIGDQATPTTLPTNTPLPPPPTQPPASTATPLPPPTAVPTAIPLPTQPPLPTAIPVTDTPSLSLVTVVNNLNQKINISITGPANHTFSVQRKSTYYFETPPGQYTYSFSALNFDPQTGYVTLEPGPFEWTWGKAQP